MPNPTSFLALERKANVHFLNKELLAQALTHRSAAKLSKVNGHNERLEFLGDAILEFVITEALYEMSDRPEGELTNWRSALVQGEHLCEVAIDLGLGEFLFMSKGEEASGGREKPSTLANALEAFIGALYLDQGLDSAKVFIHEFILKRLSSLLSKGRHRDEKSLFQEIAQEKTGKTPTYETLSEVGPDHEKVFTCAVMIGEEQVAIGTGPSKQRAEQAAAKAGLKAKGWK